MQTQHEQEPTVTISPPIVPVPTAPTEWTTQTAEHAPTTTATRKRVVSKGRYAANIGKKAAFSSAGIGILLAGELSVAVAGVFVLALTTPDALVGMLLFLLLLFGGGGLTLLYIGSRAIKEARQIDTGVPLTHANSASLSAVESLVRAASEPVQAQENVLLRAAVEQAQEKQDTELLRASSEG